MNRLAMTLAVIILAACVPATRADGMFGLFHKKVKVDPAQRVPELILTLKTEQDERKRGSAVTELGTYDSAAFAEIVPVLVDVLQHDAKASVRMDAASSLGALRPVSQLAGDALEKAATSDDNWRARLHAKSIVMRYRIAGYSPRGGQNAKSNEPPLMANTRQGTPQGPPAPNQFPAGANGVANTSVTKITVSGNEDTPSFRPSVARPLPAGPTFSTAVPQELVQPAPSALPLVESSGPPLIPFTPTSRPTTPVAPPLPGPPF